MSLIHGGSGCHLFSLSVFNYICGMKLTDIIVDVEEMPVGDAKCILEKVT